MCRCPFCDGNSSLQFNIDKGLWVCFRCDTRGNAKSLVLRLGGTYSDPAVSSEVLHKAFDRLRTRQKHMYDEGEHTLDENYLLRFQGPMHEYWRKRGFSDKTAARWGLGYDPILDRCTIAHRNPRGDLLGVIQRRLDDVFPRYIYPEGFDRLGSIFGSWMVPSFEGDTTALVEGSTDTVAVDQARRPSLSQLGSSLGKRQVLLLRQMGLRKLILFYDYDEAGRKALEDAQRKLTGFRLARVEWDTDLYCWHEKLCGCGQHSWRTIGQCKNKFKCKCGRRHNMDPGALSGKMIRQMYDDHITIGSKSEWDTHKSASSTTARGRRSGGSGTTRTR